MVSTTTVFLLLESSPLVKQELSLFGIPTGTRNLSFPYSARSPDAKYLSLSSRDGYCTIIEFENEELGQPHALSGIFYIFPFLSSLFLGRVVCRQFLIITPMIGASYLVMQQRLTSRPVDDSFRG